MNYAKSTLDGKLGKLFESPIICLIQVGILSVVLVILLCIEINIEFTRLARVSSNNVYMLASEVVTESGHNFKNAANDHEEVMKAYVEHIEQILAGLLRPLSNEYCPNKNNVDMLGITSECVCNRQNAARVVWLARENFMIFWILAESLPRLGIVSGPHMKKLRSLLCDVSGYL